MSNRTQFQISSSINLSTMQRYGDHPMKSFLRTLSFGIALLTVLSVYATGSWAQTTSASLSGVIADTTGARIPQATVILSSSKTRETRRTLSNGTGVFQF